MCSNSVWAHDFEVDGVFYKLISKTDKTVMVTYKGTSYSAYSGEYIGDVVIPENILFYERLVYATFEDWTSTNKGVASSTSKMEYSITTEVGDILEFDWYVSSESNYDKLTITIDGKQILQKSGSYSGHYSEEFNVSGTHSLVVEYKKDGSQDKGDDIGRIQNIALYGSDTQEVVYNVVEIDNHAFYGCSGLSSIELPDNVTKIGSYAFYGCSSLVSIELSNSVVEIGSYAFQNCSNLENIVIGTGVEVIPFYCFSNCKKLLSIIIPSNVIEIKGTAFENCSSLQDVIFEDGNKPLYLGYSTYQLDLGSKRYYGLFRHSPLTNVYIGRNLEYEITESPTTTPFSGKSNLKNIIISDCVTNIGICLFYNCSSLTDVELQNSVVSIGDKAFYGCSALANIELPNSITSIGSYAFYGCSALTNMELPNSITSIGSYAFYGCSALTNMELPNSITSIGSYAFYGCSDLVSIEFPDTVVSFGDRVFENCSSLNAIYIDDITTWCKYKFTSQTYNPLYYAKKLYLNRELVTSLVIPNDISIINDYAFCGCSSLTSVIIPSSVVNIGNYVFDGCNQIKLIAFEDGETTLSLGHNNTIGYSWQYETSITVYNGLFYSCPLEELYLGRNIAFNTSPVKNRNNLKIATFGCLVTDINTALFNGCTNLTDIYFYSNPSIGADAIPSTATCHLIIDDNNNIDFNIVNENTYSDVNYTRTIAEGKYGTIILPFAPDATSLENYAFYELVESGDGYMMFEEVATPIANVPYIYTLRDGKENVAITGGEASISSNIVTPEVDGWQTVGSFSNQTIDTSNGNYYALSVTDNEINRITKNLTVLPYRAYFKSSNASKSALSVYISGTTGIKEISSSEIDGFEDGVIFDLSGRKITEPAKGNIYIMDGKKIMF